MAKKFQQPPRRILRGERRSSREVDKSARRCCGLCGATDNLTKTECCGQWICDDEDQYQLFSYARNSCSRNHRRYTLCGHHSTEGHEGRWQDCSKCREDIETEMYVYYGTNEYNFEKLPDPPAFEPTLRRLRQGDQTRRRGLLRLWRQVHLYGMLFSGASRAFQSR